MASRQKVMGGVGGSWKRRMVSGGKIDGKERELWEASGEESTYLCGNDGSAKGIGRLMFGRLGAAG